MTEKASVLPTVQMALLSSPFLAFFYREGWDVNTEVSFSVCQAVFCCSPPRQMLPSSGPAALGWSLGQCLQPRGLQGQPVPHRSPPSPSPSSPHPLPPHLGALLPNQPALLGAASRRWHPNPSSCTES